MSNSKKFIAYLLRLFRDCFYSMYAQVSAQYQIFCFVVWPTPAFTISASPAPIVCLSSPLLHLLPPPRFSSKNLQDPVSKALPPSSSFPNRFPDLFSRPHSRCCHLNADRSVSLLLIPCLTSSTLLSPLPLHLSYFPLPSSSYSLILLPLLSSFSGWHYF